MNEKITRVIVTNQELLQDVDMFRNEVFRLTSRELAPQDAIDMMVQLCLDKLPWGDSASNKALIDFGSRVGLGRPWAPLPEYNNEEPLYGFFRKGGRKSRFYESRSKKEPLTKEEIR